MEATGQICSRTLGISCVRDFFQAIEVGRAGSASNSRCDNWVLNRVFYRNIRWFFGRRYFWYKQSTGTALQFSQSSLFILLLLPCCDLAYWAMVFFKKF